MKKIVMIYERGFTLSSRIYDYHKGLCVRLEKMFEKPVKAFIQDQELNFRLES